MSKPQSPSAALGRPRRTLPRVLRNTIAMVSSHPGTTALGGVTGLMAGLVSGSIAGPAGAASGAALGCTIGAAAGAALAADREERSLVDLELDRVIGVSEGNLGEADAAQHPVETESEGESEGHEMSLDGDEFFPREQGDMGSPP